MDNQLAIIGKPAENRLIKRTIFDLTQSDLERLKIMAKMYAASAINSKSNLGEGDFFLIMLKGLELGISPMAAVDTINIIAGKPVLDAKGMLGLVKSSGLLENIHIDSSALRCVVTVKRLGNVEQDVSFSIEDAKTFKTYEKGAWIPLADKANWKSQPATMLKWRAVAAAMREVFPDVISGLYTPEELDADNTHVNPDGSMELADFPALPSQAPSPVSSGYMDTVTGDIVESPNPLDLETHLGTPVIHETGEIKVVEIRLSDKKKPYIVAGGTTLFSRQPFRDLGYEDDFIELLAKPKKAVYLPDAIVIGYTEITVENQKQRTPVKVCRVSTGQIAEIQHTAKA